MRGGRSEEGEGFSGGGGEVELGAEDRVGILEVMDGSLDGPDIWGLREE